MPHRSSLSLVWLTLTMETEKLESILGGIVLSCIDNAAMNHVFGTMYWKPTPDVDDGTVFESLECLSGWKYNEDSPAYKFAEQLCNIIARDGWDAKLLNKPKLTIKSNTFHANYVKKFGVNPQDLVWSVISDKGYITLRQLVEGVYRMKISKSDSDFERFTWYSLRIDREDEEGYEIYVDFD